MERGNSIKGWMLLAAGLLFVLAAAFLFDQPIDHWVALHRAAGFKMLAKLCSRFFAWHWLMLYAAAGLLIAWLVRRRDWMRVLCAMMIAASIAGLSADLLRGLTGRTRPYNQETPQGWYGVRHEGRWLIGKHAYNSFPSGHTTAICGFALPLFLWRRRLGAVVFPLLLLVAGARVYLSAHHPSDVVAGAILGGSIAFLVWRKINARA